MKVISMYIRGLILIISICIFVYNNYKKKITREIESTSPRYIALKGLQDKYKFNRISREMPFILILDSKYKYDHVDYQKQIYKIVCCNRDVIENIIEATEENNRLYEAYKKEHSALPAFRDEIIDDNRTFSRFYKKMEHKVLQNEERKQGVPVTEIRIALTKKYTSPQGRNHYQETMLFYMNEIKSCIYQSYSEEYKKADKKYQRKALTASLRYDILKRDGFRCVLCGRTPKDGITLHVDHILPVSKGGLTEPSNPRTLCSICNLGKSDKYDSNGPN